MLCHYDKQEVSAFLLCFMLHNTYLYTFALENLSIIWKKKVNHSLKVLTKVWL